MQEPDQPDAKTLIRHAMQALQDEFGTTRVAHLVWELQHIHNDIRRLEGISPGLTPVRSIAANIGIDHPRLEVVPKPSPGLSLPRWNGGDDVA